MGPTVRLGLALYVAVGVFALAKLALVNDGVAFHVAFNLNHLLWPEKIILGRAEGRSLEVGWVDGCRVWIYSVPKGGGKVQVRFCPNWLSTPPTPPTPPSK
jgi:hypothetical protein